MSAEDYEEGTTLHQIASLAEEYAMARWQRDDWIRYAHAEDYSLREIAQAAGLSHAGVKKIVERPNT